jgi:transposase-like protein
VSAPYGKPLSDLASAEQQAAVVELVRQGQSFRDIAARLGISKSQAHRAFHHGLDRIPAANVHAYREEQLADLALARQVVYGILGAHHVTISNGHVVSEITGTDDDGQPVYGDPYEDTAPTLAALDRLVKIGQREAEIVGSDAPSKAALDVQVNYTVGGGVDLGALT